MILEPFLASVARRHADPPLLADGGPVDGWETAMLVLDLAQRAPEGLWAAAEAAPDHRGLTARVARAVAGARSGQLADPRWEELIQAALQRGDEAALALLLAESGRTRGMAWDLGRATADLQWSLHLAERRGAHRLAAVAAGNLGAVAVQRGDPAALARAVSRALDHAERGGDHLCAMHGLQALAAARLRTGEREAAEAPLRALAAALRPAAPTPDPRPAGAALLDARPPDGDPLLYTWALGMSVAAALTLHGPWPERAPAFHQAADRALAGPRHPVARAMAAHLWAATLAEVGLRVQAAAAALEGVPLAVQAHLPALEAALWALIEDCGAPVGAGPATEAPGKAAQRALRAALAVSERRARGEAVRLRRAQIAAWEAQRARTRAEAEAAQLRQTLQRQEATTEVLRSAATTDALTGLPNRRALEDRLRRVAADRRVGRGFALAVVDVDHFKAINDSLGHAVGDEVLIELGARLQSSCRAQDLAARWGGEEFVLLFTDVDPGAAMAAAENLRRLVSAQPAPTSSGPVRVTVSVGVAAVTHTPVEPARVFAAADGALYAAKRSGRDRVLLAGVPAEAPRT
jgi:diguanylate cyclase (GGDEF)-like protein